MGRLRVGFVNYCHGGFGDAGCIVYRVWDLGFPFVGS